VSVSPGTDVLRLLVESVQDYAIFLLDETGRILSWNAGAQRIKGYTPQEVIGKHVSIFYPEEDLAWDKPGRELKTALREGRAEEEGWRVRKDGSRFWASVVTTPLYEPDGRLRGFGKVTRDLTERRRSDEERQRSEEEFGLLVGSVLDYAIFRLDQDGYVQTWNAGAERIKGWLPEEIIGKHFSTFYTQEDVDDGKPERELQIARAEGRVEDEGWRVRKDGSRFWANVVITALYGDDGELRGFAKVTRDLTDRRKAELAKDRFIANAAHELRTPLSVIIGLSSHLKNPAVAADPEFPDLVDALARQSVRMRTLVNNLLDLTQVAQGKVTSLADVLLGEAIEHALQTLPPPEGKTVEIEVPELTVVAHDTRLDQIITNLLSNAYRYGGDHIRLRAEERGPDLVVLEVSDNGPGIADDMRLALFEPFKRGAGTQHIEGSGLGLAIVKGFVESFGGRIEYDPTDQGARFVIHLKRGGVR